MKTDIKHFISKLSEVEMVDSFNAIERHLGELQVSAFNTLLVINLPVSMVFELKLVFISNNNHLCCSLKDNDYGSYIS